MAIDEIKRSLQEKLAHLSIEQLQEVDRFIDHINPIPAEEYDLLAHAEDVIAERENVLKKLA